jgi:Ca2+-binding EF-hand superfamily protein
MEPSSWFIGFAVLVLVLLIVFIMTELCCTCNGLSDRTIQEVMRDQARFQRQPKPWWETFMGRKAWNEPTKWLTATNPGGLKVAFPTSPARALRGKHPYQTLDEEEEQWIYDQAKGSPLMALINGGEQSPVSQLEQLRAAERRRDPTIISRAERPPYPAPLPPPAAPEAAAAPSAANPPATPPVASTSTAAPMAPIEPVAKDLASAFASAGAPPASSAAFTELHIAPKASKAGAMDLFRMLDEDASGTVTREEFWEALSARGLVDESIELLFSECDRDGDGTVTMLEFGKAIKKHPHLIPKQATIDLFKAIDEDNSGSVTYDEFKASLEARGLASDSIEQLFKSCDKDGDGSVTILEFGRAIKKHPELMPASISLSA